MQKLMIDDFFISQANIYKDLFVGRISSESKGLYKVICESGEILARVSGKLRFDTVDIIDLPAVGDFVMLDRMDNKNGDAIIHNILARKSAFIRKLAGTNHQSQVVATNIDTVFICMSLNNDFNLRRIERYLSIAWDSGAVPVIVLTKADLCDDAKEKLAEVTSVSVGADVLLTSAINVDGYIPIKNYIAPGKTVAFIGSSGVGKSTLVNKLLGNETMPTSGLRNDDKGRHTTTRRELILLENGATVIDTPGMREIGLVSVDTAKTFEDIEMLAMSCKFHDCTHTKEPKCAVLNAISNNTLSDARLQNYKKLKKEAKYDALNSRQIEHTKLNEMFAQVGGMKNARDFAKNKNRM